MDVHYSSDEQDHCIIIRIKISRATSLYSTELRVHLIDLLKAGNIMIVVDFKEVHFVDSSYFSALLAGQKSAIEAGGEIKLANCQPHIKNLLRITQLERIFRCYPSTESASADFRQE